MPLRHVAQRGARKDERQVTSARYIPEYDRRRGVVETLALKVEGKVGCPANIAERAVEEVCVLQLLAQCIDAELIVA